MNRITLLLFVLLAVTITYFVVANSQIEGSTELKLAHALPTAHPVHMGMEAFAQLVEERTNGRVTVAIFANGQLGQEKDTLELVQVGALDMAKASVAVLENFFPIYSIFSLPFIFRTEQHHYNVLDGPVGDELLAAGESRNIVGLTYYAEGTRGFFVSKPVYTPADLKGLKIRSQQNSVAIAMMVALGAIPTPLDVGEIYTALQTKIIEGAENNIPTYGTSKLYEVAKYFTYTDHQMVPDMLMINKQVLERFSEEDQAIIKQAARDSFIIQRDYWDESRQESRKEAEAGGATFIEVDKAPFVEATKDIIAEYRSKNSDIDRLLTAIEATEG